MGAPVRDSAPPAPVSLTPSPENLSTEGLLVSERQERDLNPQLSSTALLPGKDLEPRHSCTPPFLSSRVGLSPFSASTP